MCEIEVNGPLLSRVAPPSSFMYVPFVGHLLQPPSLPRPSDSPQTTEPQEPPAVNCDVYNAGFGPESLLGKQGDGGAAEGDLNLKRG